MDVSPPRSSAPSQPAGVTGVTCEVFRHLRVPPGLGSLGGFRFPRCFAGLGRTRGLVTDPGGRGVLCGAFLDFRVWAQCYSCDTPEVMLPFCRQPFRAFSECKF